MQALLSSKVPTPAPGSNDPVTLQRYVVMSAITETIREQGLDTDSPTPYLGALMAALTVNDAATVQAFAAPPPRCGGRKMACGWAAA